MQFTLPEWLPRYLRKVTISRRHLVISVCIVLALFISSVSLFRLSPYNAHEKQDQYFRAKVLQVKQEQSDFGAQLAVDVRLLDGNDKDKTVHVTWPDNFGDAAARRLPTGSEVLLSKPPKADNYGLISRWYMPGIATILITLLTFVVIIGAWRGITSVFGLAISVLILSAFVVPQIIAGHDAFTACIQAAVAITLISIYVAHGVSKRTTVAFISSLVSLLVVVGLTAVASYVSGTSEIITEDSAYIFSASHPIDVSGLLTGGVVIASLGTLFDITTGQAATVDEIHKANRRQTTGQLFIKGMSVGREHIAALINTLALVYAGVALPTIVLNQVLYAQNTTYAHLPLVVRLNTESVAEEVMRTGVASMGMLLALPITTWLAAYVLPKWTPTVSRKMKQRLRDL
jgi:uncharacterized membrane protein